MHEKPSIIFAGASFTYFHLHFLKLIGHLRMDGWEAILSIWDKRPIFRAELLVGITRKFQLFKLEFALRPFSTASHSAK